MEEVTSENRFKCHICLKDFVTRQSLEFHKRTHTDEKPFQCEICNKSFSQKYNLTVHMRTHAK